MNRKVRWLLLTFIVGMCMALVPGSALAAAKAAASNSSAGSNNLQPGQILYANQSLISTDSLSTLIMQGDGNLVLSRAGYGVLWSSRTPGNPGAFVGMQTDGNLVLWNANWRVLWASNTGGYYGASATVQNDSNFVIYLNGGALWATNTNSSYGCANFWDQNIGWSGGFQWNDTVYAGYCWNGYQVWHRYGPDCSTSVSWQGISGSPYGNDTTACFTSGDWTGQLLVGYNWSWYVYLSPWDKHPGNYLRFVVNANGQIITRWGQVGV